TEENVLDRLGDESFNLVRCEPGRFGLNHRLRWRKFREDAQLRTESGIDTVSKCEAGQRDHDSPKVQRECNDGLEHRLPHSSGWICAFSSSDSRVCAPVTTMRVPGVRLSVTK